MSRFSSKCDLWDWLGMAAEQGETMFDCYKRLNTQLFLHDGNEEQIKIEKPSDLVPYYPYYDAVHIFTRGKSDYHSLCPPKYGEHTELFYKDALYSELQRVIAEEDPKYVQEV